MIPLLLLLAAAAPACSPLPGGAEVCLVKTGETPWVELALGFEAGPDPPGKRGLTAVVRAALLAELRGVAPGLEIDADPHGLRLTAGAPTADLEALLERIFAVLSARQVPASATEAAVSVATFSRRQIADDDRALARLELFRGLYAEAPGMEVLGHPRELATVTADDLASYLRQHVCSGALRLVLAGSVRELEVQRLGALTGTLPACATAPKASGVTKGAAKSGLDLLIVDKPERAFTTILIGAELEAPGPRPALEAALAVMARDLGRRLGTPLVDARLDAAPLRSGWLLALETTRPERDLGLLLEQKVPSPDAAERGAARRFAALDASLRIRDPRAMASTVLDARLRGSEANGPWALGPAILEVSDEALKAALKSLYRDRRFIVAVTSADSARVQALGRVPGIRGTSVVGYDTR